MTPEQVHDWCVMRLREDYLGVCEEEKEIHLELIGRKNLSEQINNYVTKLEKDYGYTVHED